MEFWEGDYFSFSYKEADVIYCYSTCLPEELFRQLAAILSRDLEPGSRVLTVSKSLTDFEEGKKFVVVDRFQLNFTWGKAEVFCHIFMGDVLQQSEEPS